MKKSQRTIQCRLLKKEGAYLSFTKETISPLLHIYMYENSFTFRIRPKPKIRIDPCVEQRKRMDAIDSVFDPLREFAKDSVRLVKRCHKPDRKGNNSFQFPSFSFWYSRKFWKFFCGRNSCKYAVFLNSRIHEGCVPYGDRIRRNGVRWLLCEADLHPNQQYYRRIWLGRLI